MNFVHADSVSNGIGDGIGMVFVSQMVKHIDGSIQHGHRVSDVLASDCCASVTSARLEDGILNESETHGM